MAYATKEQDALYRISRRKQIRDYDKTWRRANKARVSAKNKRYESKIGIRDRKEYFKNYNRKYYDRRKEKEAREYIKKLKYERTKRDKEKQKEYNRQYHAKNREKRLAQMKELYQKKKAMK